MLNSQQLNGLFCVGMRLFVYNSHHIPQDSAVLVVSNHRSSQDASVLMQALQHPIRIACHHYMGQVPIMREFVQMLGCFPLAKPEQRTQAFFQQASKLLQTGQWVGLFPEGASPMLQLTDRLEVGKFERGFAHLALRVRVPNLAVLPVAIASTSESVFSAVPLRFLRLFDPHEPLFDREGRHPVVIYHRANVLIGRPFWIGELQRQQYQGKEAKQAVNNLTQHCQQEITQLLRKGCNYV